MAEQGGRLSAARVATSILSGLPQAFDAIVVAAAAWAVFPKLHFAGLTPAWGLAAGAGLWAFAYLVGFATRPALTDSGPRPAGEAVASRTLFAVSTLAIGLLPAGGDGALPAVLLVTCRMGQGLALGGTARPEVARGLLGVRLATVGTALLAAGGLFGALAALLTPAEFIAWGWRLPFVAAAALNLAGLAADLRLSQRFQHGRELPPLMSGRARSGLRGA